MIVHTRGSSNEDFLYNVTGDQIDELYAFGYSGLSNLIVSGDEVVFEVSRQQSVWGTDGTAAGTRKTGDIPTGSNGRGFSSNGKVYSSFRSGGIGIELSVLDLAADQRTILDINPGRSSSYAAVIRGDYGGDTLLWTANAGLWATDGTSVGTRSLNTEISGPGNRNISNVTNTDNGIVFLSRAIDGDRTAWKSDGIQSTALTAETPLKFEPCIDGSLLGCVRPTPTFTQFRDTTYVLASEQSSFKRFALWEVDDVSGEIQRVSTPEGLRFVGVDYIKVIGEQMYFVATTETGFREVWTTDGTTDGWQMLLQVEEDGSTELEQIVELNGEAYFIESRFSEGRTLWKTDGTVAGTEPVDVFPNPPRVPRFDVQLYEASDQLFAIAEAENGNVEVYRIDGSPGGAVQVVPDAFGGMRLLRFSAAVFGNELIFQRDTETGGSAELWITDGSLEGTRHILDASDDGIRFIGSAADQFYFALDNESLWVTDGTKAGTTSISDVAINSWDLASYATDDGIFFAGTSDESGSELWFSDGTAEGTHEFADILPGPLGSEPSSITSVDGMLLVGVNDDGFGGGVVEIPLLEKSPMPGDADGNGAVEFADFLILSSNFGKNADAAFADGDFNEDGKVNFNDFLLLSTNFGR